MSTEQEVVKKPNALVEYTQEQEDDLRLCKEDPLFFIRKYVMIQHPLLGGMLFEPYPYQVEMLEAFHTHNKVVALTGRQQGKTTSAAAYLLWRAMFVPNSTILVAANILTQAYEIMDRIRYAYENVPDQFRAGVTVYNRGSITFDNGSRILSRATTPTAGRGLAISLLYVDEFAFVNPSMAKDFWTAIAPVLSTGGDCIITSTPKSDVDQFATIYKEAADNRDSYGNPNEDGLGSNGFFAMRFPWHVHPERDEEWANKFRKIIGPAKFKQEFECVAGDTSLTVMNAHGEIEKTSIADLFGVLAMCSRETA